MDEQKFRILADVSPEFKDVVVKGLKVWFSDISINAEQPYAFTLNWSIYTQTKVSYRKLEEMTKFAQGICYGFGYAKKPDWTK